MNAHQQRWDIEEIVEDGLNATIRDLVRREEWNKAKTIAAVIDDAKREITKRLQKSFRIQRPRKR